MKPKKKPVDTHSFGDYTVTRNSHSNQKKSARIRYDASLARIVDRFRLRLNDLDDEKENP